MTRGVSSILNTKILKNDHTPKKIDKSFSMFIKICNFANDFSAC